MVKVILVLAALLHDIGHVVGDAGDWGDPDHAAAGARFLQPMLPADVVEPIRLHVDAKRYLVAVDADYASQLSHASQVTLRQQGGPFTRDEVAEFAALPHAERAIQLRRADDAGKQPGRSTPTLESFRDRRISDPSSHGPLSTAPWSRTSSDSSRITSPRGETRARQMGRLPAVAQDSASPSRASRTSILHVAFSRSAKALVKRPGRCCTNTIPGVSMGSLPSTTSRARVPPMDAPIATIRRVATVTPWTDSGGRITSAESFPPTHS